MLLLIAACAAPPRDMEASSSDPEPLAADTAAPTVPPTGTTSTPTPSTTTVGTFDCSTLASGPFAVAATLPIPSYEDFDFDADGRLLAQVNFDDVGAYDQTGVFTVIGSTGDLRGIGVLPDGGVAVATYGGGAIVRLDPATGGVTPLVSGLSEPDGLEVGRDGTIFFTEYGGGRVRSVASDGLTDVVLASGLSYPNGLALSPDETHLYVVTDYPGSRVVVFDKDVDGNWSGPSPLWDSGGLTLDGMDVDACGNVYVMQLTPGVVERIDPLTGIATEIADIPSHGYFSAARFGSGVGGWAVDSLYVSDRENAVFEIPVGVPGKTPVF